MRDLLGGKVNERKYCLSDDIKIDHSCQEMSSSLYRTTVHLVHLPSKYCTNRNLYRTSGVGTQASEDLDKNLCMQDWLTNTVKEETASSTPYRYTRCRLGICIRLSTPENSE